MVTSEWMGGTKIRTFVRGVSRVGTLCGLVAGLAFYTSCVTPPPPEPCATDADCDNGDFCDGAETCDVDSGDCADGTAPCTEDEVCLEATDACATPCESDDDCDDANECTDDACDTGINACSFTSNTADCDDGEDCTSGDVCADSACAGTPDEGCCKTDADCDGDDVCGDFDADSGLGTCGPPPAEGCTVDGCPDSTFCAPLVCNEDTGECEDGTAPCAEGEICADATETCATVCTSDADCDDADECTDDACDTGIGLCSFTSNAADCDDFDACTSGDVCAAGVCAGTDDVTCCEVDDDCDTGAGEVCANIDVDTGLGTCTGGCVDDADCDDGDLCTTNACVDGGCVPTDVDVDNGVFCDGVETCDSATGDAVDGDDPCDADTEVCDEDTESCLAICTDDAGCDDGLFCNGDETCANIDGDGNGTCAAGTDPCAAEQACDEVAGSCECSAGVSGQTIILSFGSNVGPDFEGDCGDDTFLADIEIVGGTPFQTLDSNDELDGKTGQDRLNVQFRSTAAQSTSPAALTSIETFDCNVTTGFAQTFNMVNADSAETINNNNSSVDGADLLITNLPVAPTAIGWSNGTEVFKVTVTSTALSGSSDTCAITLSGIVDPGDSQAILTLQPSSAGSGYETFNVTSSGGIAQVVEQITDGDGTSLSTINIDGGTKLTITMELDPSVTTVNASASTGGVVIAPDSTNVNTVCTGGSGNDTFDFSGLPGDYTSTDTVAGGEGTDTLVLDDADADVTTAQANVSEIEVIEVNTTFGAAIDITFFGATKFKASGDWNGQDVTIPDGGSVEYDVATGGNITILSKSSGLDNTMTLDLDTSVATGNDIIVSTWENITLNIDNAAVTTGGTFQMGNSGIDETLTITGSQNLTLGDDTGDTLTVDVLDASAFTGTLVMVGLPASGIITITGGFGGDTLIGGNGNTDDDVIDGKDGNDTIEGNDGNDVLTGGNGSDTFVFEADAVSNNNDVIQDFSTTDILNFQAFATGGTPAGTVSDTATGNTATVDNDVWLVTDADGSIDTPAEIAALFVGGGTPFGVGSANADVVVIIIDTQAGGSSSVWYVDNDGTPAIIAGECVQVATLSSFNTILVDANITD